jgi:hypothetical protein
MSRAATARSAMSAPVIDPFLMSLPLTAPVRICELLRISTLAAVAVVVVAPTSAMMATASAGLGRDSFMGPPYLVRRIRRPRPLWRATG